MNDATDAEIGDALTRARALIASLRPLLAGQGSAVQGAALVELVALHLAGHAPDTREEILELHVNHVRAMVPMVEREMFGTAGHPSVRDS